MCVHDDDADTVEIWQHIISFLRVNFTYMSLSWRYWQKVYVVSSKSDPPSVLYPRMMSLSALPPALFLHSLLTLSYLRPALHVSSAVKKARQDMRT